MPFAVGLRDSLRVRGSLAPDELARGDSLEHVLGRHLLAVEDMADSDLLTSILLLDPDGKRLWHGAAPNLPTSYCDAIDGSQIGPSAGSCGTAAFLGEPIYVADIASDPLWADYRHLALPHGLRACWSTPIRNSGGAVIGTFAIYHRSIGTPTQDELKAIEMITEQVARAIVLARNIQDVDPRAARPAGHKAGLRLVPSASDTLSVMLDRLMERADRLQSLAEELERCANEGGSGAGAPSFTGAAADCKRLVSVLRDEIERHGSSR